MPKLLSHYNNEGFYLTSDDRYYYLVDYPDADDLYDYETWKATHRGKHVYCYAPGFRLQVI